MIDMLKWLDYLKEKGQNMRSVSVLGIPFEHTRSGVTLVDDRLENRNGSDTEVLSVRTIDTFSTKFQMYILLEEHTFLVRENCGHFVQHGLADLLIV